MFEIACDVFSHRMQLLMQSAQYGYTLVDRLLVRTPCTLYMHVSVDQYLQIVLATQWPSWRVYNFPAWEDTELLTSDPSAAHNSPCEGHA